MKIILRGLLYGLLIPFFCFNLVYGEDYKRWTDIQKPIKDKDISWSDIVEKVKNGIVAIETSATTLDILQPFRPPQEVTLNGSGFFISKEGYLLTNSHVVVRAKKIHILTPKAGFEKFEVELVGLFLDGDIAILKLKDEEMDKFLEYNKEITVLPLSDSDAINEGENILALGYPLNKPNITITEGIVSGFTRNIGDNYQYIQTNSALNPGNSGGPSLDKNGAVIGINSGIARDAQNIGYIIPINIIKIIIPQLLKSKKADFPSLGIIWSWNYEDTAKYLKGPPKAGFIVTKVIENGSANKAGIKRLDVITKLGDTTIDFYGEGLIYENRRETFKSLLNRYPVESTIPIQYYRDGKEYNSTITLDKAVELPIRQLDITEDPDYEIWGGMVLQELNLNIIGSLNNSSLMKYYEINERFTPRIVITHIFKNSQAQKNRILSPGHIVEKINGKNVFTLKEVRDILDNIDNEAYIAVETIDGRIAALDVTAAKGQEEELRKIHKYSNNRPSKPAN